MSLNPLGRMYFFPPAAMPRIPEVSVGPVRVPRLFLGDHGFLRKFGSTMNDHAVLARMREAIRTSGLGLAVGEERLLALANRARAPLHPNAPVMYHADLPLTLDGVPMRYPLCGATLRRGLMARGVTISADPVLRYLDRFDAARALAEHEVARVTADPAGLTRFAETLREYSPAVVTIGGDWLDMLLLAGAEELATRALTSMLASCHAAGAAGVCTLYVGAITGYRLPASADGLMVPLNVDGVAMLPDRDAARRWALSQGKPIVAMHALGSHSRPVLDVLRALTSHAHVVVVGASRRLHLQELIDAVAARPFTKAGVR